MRWPDMIDVRLYAALSRVDGSGPAEFKVESRLGLRVRDVVAEAGIREEDVAIAMINGHAASLDSPLTDSDRLGLFPAVSGG
jgi:molybdopterin converting factor small subunit